MSQTNISVLVVDDDGGLRRVLGRDLVLDYGFVVDVMATSAPAFTAVAAEPARYHVAAVDQTLDTNDRDGISVLDGLKTLAPELECILMSGNRPEELTQARQVSDFIRKPFEVDDLAMRILAAAQQAGIRGLARDLLAAPKALTGLLPGSIHEQGYGSVLARAVADAQRLTLADGAVAAVRRQGTEPWRIYSTPGLQWSLDSWSPALSERILAGGRLYRAPGGDGDEPIAPELLRAGIVSLAGIPIICEQASVGVLYVHSQRPGRFERWNMAGILSPIASLTGQALTAVEATERSAAHVRGMEAFAGLASGFTQTRRQQDLLDLTWKYVEKRLEVATFYVGLIDPDDSERLIFPLAYEDREPIDIPPRPLANDPHKWGASWGVVRSQKELYWGNAEEREAACRVAGIDVISVGLISPQRQTCFYVPLISNDKVFGLISIQAERSNAFPAVLLDAFRSVAGQLAIALDNARSFERLERRSRFLEALEQAEGKIQTEQKSPGLAQTIVREAVRLLPCDAGMLLLHKPHLQLLEVAEVWGLPSELNGQTVSHSNGICWRALETGQLAVPKADELAKVLDPCLQAQHFRHAVAVPLLPGAEAEAVLILADRSGRFRLGDLEREVLQRYAERAARALQASRLIGAEGRMLSQLDLLHKITDFMAESAHDLDKMLHAALTGITASYGLRLNRALVLLYEPEHKELRTSGAIGPLTQAEAEEIWRRFHQQGLDSFEQYVRRVASDKPEPSFLQTRCSEIILREGTKEAEMVFKVLHGHRCQLLDEEKVQGLPGALRNALGPVAPLVMAPLHPEGAPIGVILADNAFTHTEIRQETIELLTTYATTVGLAVRNHLRHQQLQRSEGRLRSAFQASKAVVLSEDPDSTLHEIVKQAMQAAEASGVAVVLMDELNKPSRLVSEGIDAGRNVDEMVSEDGLSQLVFKTGERVRVEDARKSNLRLNPKMFDEHVQAGLALPLTHANRRIGVMWIHYSEPHDFSQDEEKALQLFADQAAMTYIDANRMREVTSLIKAISALAREDEPQSVLREIAGSVLAVLKAHSAAILSYNGRSRKFIRDESAAEGADRETLEHFFKDEPDAGGLTEAVLQGERACVRDLEHPQPDDAEIGPATRIMLNRTGVRSFQAIPLRIGGEVLGLLFINYDRPRNYCDDDWDMIESFAGQAALALRRARLLQRIVDTQRAAEVVAATVLRNDLNETLQTITDQVRTMLDSHIITIYAYDENEGRFWSHAVSPATMESVHRPDQIGPKSVVHKAISQAQEYYWISSGVQDDEILGGDFARAHQLEAAIAWKLMANGKPVGVMFANYLEPHEFAVDEIRVMRLLANHAAVAIDNARLFRHQTTHNAILKIRLKAEERLTQDLEEDTILRETLEHAIQLTGAKGDMAQSGSIVIVEGDRLVPRVALPQSIGETMPRGAEFGSPICDANKEPIGLLGRVVVQKEPILCDDLSAFRDPDPGVGLGAGSALVVPIVKSKESGADVLGIISLYHWRTGAFNSEDSNAIRMLANLSAMALSNARMHRQSQETLDTMRLIGGYIGSMTVVEWMEMMIKTMKHKLNRRVSVVRMCSGLIDQELIKLPVSTDRTREILEIRRQLADIDKEIGEILEVPFAEPLTADVTKWTSIRINGFLEGFIRRRTPRLREKGIEVLWQPEPNLDRNVVVRASTDWLRRVFEVLLDNAVDALDTPGLWPKKITVTTGLNGKSIEVRVIDTGRGIAPAIQPDLYRRPIEKQAGAKGMGVGATLASTIISVYQGTIDPETSKFGRTCILVRLPAQLQSPE